MQEASLTEIDLNDDAAFHFEAVVQFCEDLAYGFSVDNSETLSPSVPGLLRDVFARDFEKLLSIKRTVQNVTCMRPADENAVGVYCPDLRKLALRPGRVCQDGDCCEACSRVSVPGFATPAECHVFRQQLREIMGETDSEVPSQLLELEDCWEAGDVNVRTTLTFVRLVERMRRAIAHEYGLRLSSITPGQAYVSRIIGQPGDEDLADLFDQEDPQDSEELQELKALRDLVGASPDTEVRPPHSDEAADSFFHYSALLYLSSQNDDFEGGGLGFDDPSELATGERRILSSLSPQRGLGVMFTSGWENLHFVEPVTSGCRLVMPMFFITRAPTEAHEDEDVDDGAIAEALWKAALKPGPKPKFKEFLRRWHYFFAAGCKL